MSKHTPGPWTMGRWVSRGQPARVVESEGGIQIATVRSPNAELVAAAPDMLNALRWAHNQMTKRGFICLGGADCDVCAAIAKAVGQS